MAALKCNNRTSTVQPRTVIMPMKNRVWVVGLAAVLLQLRYYNREHGNPIQAPVWLNIVGVLFALIALLADFLGLSWEIAQVMALGAVGSFGISSAMILHAFRKHRTISK